MSQVRDRLRKAIDNQRSLAPGQRPGPADAAAAAALQPVRDAAAELRDELSNVPGLKIDIAPGGVWIELYDKHFRFEYDPAERIFIGTEQETRWMEGGLRETSYRWNHADACIEAMVQACARYAWLAEAIGRLRASR
jgi:hypothetical protein